MRIEFDVTLKESDLYRFNMRHAYAKGQGIISIVMALVCLIAAVKTHGSVELSYTMLYAVFSAVFLVYLPISLYLRSKRQMIASEALRRSLRYVVDPEGIHAFQDGESADLPWGQVYQVASSRRYVWIYSSRVNAYIIPRSQIEGKYEALRQIVGEQLPKYKWKMK